MDKDLRLELYKRLKTEESTYVQKVPALWLQKILLVGAMIAVGVIEHPKSPVEHWMVVAAVVALAIILDARMFEYALHSRLVSSYISDCFSDASDIADWEGVLWGLEAKSHRHLTARMRHRHLLALMRSGLSIAVTVVPTMIIALLAGTYIDAAIHSDVPIWTIVGGCVCVFYAITCYVAWRLLYKRPSGPDNEGMQADAGSPRP